MMHWVVLALLAFIFLVPLGAAFAGVLLVGAPLWLKPLAVLGVLAVAIPFSLLYRYGCGERLW